MKKRMFVLLLLLAGLLSLLNGCIISDPETTEPSATEETVAPESGIYMFPEGRISFSLNEKYGFLDEAGNEVIPAKFDWVTEFHDGLSCVLVGSWENGKWGYIDTNGNYVIEPKYEDAMPFREDGLAVAGKDGKYGYINKTGAFVISPQFDYACDFAKNDLAVATADDKWGYIDRKGKWVIEPSFEIAEDFLEQNIAFVLINGKYGCIKADGSYLLEPEYDALWYSENVGWIYGVKYEDSSEKTKFLCFDTEGKLILNTQYEELEDFSENGLALYKENGKYGFINKKGETVIAPIYDAAWGFFGDLAMVRLGDFDTGKWGFIDSTGKMVVSTEYENLGWFDENGLASAMKDQMFGYIDKTGKFVIDPIYDYAEKFSGGYAAVMQGDLDEGKWGYIDTQGNYLIEPKFQEACSFTADGYAVVMENGLYGIIDRTGKEIVPCKYDSLGYFSYYGD